MADGEEYTTPATIEDPDVLGEVTDTLRAFGYPRQPSGSS
jgi:hypothetical protein